MTTVDEATSPSVGPWCEMGELPATMRACVYDAGAPSGISLLPTKEVPTVVSAPGLLRPGNVVCRVCAFGVNPVDSKYGIGDKFPETWMDWSARRATGQVPGFDFSGVVVKAPAGCDFKEGDEVFGFACNPTSFVRQGLAGSFAEYCSPPLDQIARKPANLPHELAAALPLVGTTALQALEENGFKSESGQRVLIVGASGGVGHVAVQVAAILGAHVVGVCSGSNEGFVRECGARTVLDYRGGDIFEKISTEAATRGAFDMVLDCVNSADSRDQSVSYRHRIMAMDGVLNRDAGAKYVVLGGHPKEWIVAGVKRLTGIDFFAKNFELFWIKMPNSRRHLELLGSLVQRSRLCPRALSV